MPDILMELVDKFGTKVQFLRVDNRLITVSLQMEDHVIEATLSATQIIKMLAAWAERDSP